MTYRVNAGEWHDLPTVAMASPVTVYDDDPNTSVPRGSA